MYEIALRHLPYQAEIGMNKKKGGKGMNTKMMLDIASGKLRPRLDDAISRKECRKFNIGRSFTKRKLE